MGQKINPTGFRLSVSRNWNSRWYAGGRDFPRMLGEDLQVRDYLRRKLRNASVGRILIERPAKNARITIYSARPGVVIGKKGEDIEALKVALQKMMGVPVHVNIDEIRKPELDAQLIADSITQQLEKRIMFRRAMKRAMQNAMRLGAQGIKIMSSGRLNGIEIARTEWYREGRVPLHTLRADIDYGFSEAKTTYGVIGVKVWVYKGEMLGRGEAPGADAPPPPEREERRPRRPAGDRPGAPGARPPSGARRPPSRRTEAKSDGGAQAAAPAPAAEAAAHDDASKPAVKRVRKVATKSADGKPADAKSADGKSEGKTADTKGDDKKED
jgi:small subunit ribosomal protein S3